MTSFTEDQKEFIKKVFLDIYNNINNYCDIHSHDITIVLDEIDRAEAKLLGE